MTPVFADTSFYLAMFSEDDSAHASALRWSRENARPLVLTEFILSFAVMRDRALADAVATDRHFEQAGFRLLLK